MTSENESPLDVYDIQGHVFPGFGSAHSMVAAFRLNVPSKGRDAVGRLIPEVTLMADALRDKEARRASFRSGKLFPEQSTPSLAVSFSSNALEQWGYPTKGHDISFQRGMLDDLQALGDPIDNQNSPIDWLFGHNDDTRIDMLLVGGHSSESALERIFLRWRGILEPSWGLVHCDSGYRRPGDKEFFGFNDGISQPAVRGLAPDGNPVSARVIEADDPRSKEFARPGQRLIWPGNFIFGYEREVSGSTESGTVFTPPQSWMRNGSYLVYRRLNQDVRRFQEAIKNLEEHLIERGEVVNKNWIAARLVGRWPDGSPVIMTPDTSDPSIGNDALRNNNFRYQFKELPTTVIKRDGSTRVIPSTASDPLGKIVPQMAHIRQVNPRSGQSEEGAEVHPLKLMLRRGVTFGKEIEEDADAERGLIFLAYQTSIVRQFLFLQSTWTNSSNAPTSVGRDPIMGQDGSVNPQRNLRIPAPSGKTHRCPFHGRWVTPTAGAYLFAPGITGLREIAHSVFVANVTSVSVIDDLTRIKGIGPTSKKKLASIGITNFEQLARLTNSDIDRLDDQVGLGKRLRRDNWVTQAQHINRTV